MKFVNVEDARLVDLQSIRDHRGTLVVAESGTHTPFSIARVFSALDTPVGVTRGHHAHKRCHQLLTCLAGSVTVRVDDGESSREFALDAPGKALYLPAGLWGEQTIQAEGTVLAVFCNRKYEEADYLRNYEEFLTWRAERQRILNPEGPIRLNLGCGGRPLRDFINIDLDTLDEIRARYPNKRFDDDLIVEQFDLFNLPYEDSTVDLINSDAMLEHMGFAEEPLLFREIVRVLKPGGLLTLTVPDFEGLVRIWLDAEDDWQDFFRNDDEAIAQTHWFGTYTYAMDNRWGYLCGSFYGNQNGAGQFHANFYTAKKLVKICERVGLKVEEVDHFRWLGDRDPMIRLRAVKA